MTDIVRATTHAEVRQLCTDIAGSTILPQHFRDKPANVLVALMAADALGIDKFTALQEMFVVNGKMGMSAGLTATLVRKAGHRLRVLESTSERATIEIVRADDPESPFRVTWTMEDARRAGLTGGSWQKFPAAMLVARATTACARMACAEALSGVAYTKDELTEGQAEDEADTSIIVEVPQEWASEADDGAVHPEAGTSVSGTAPSSDIEDAVVVDETTGEVGTGGEDPSASPVSRYTGPDDPALTRRYNNPTEPAGKAAVTRLVIAMKQGGVPEDRDSVIAWCSAQLERAVESRNELTAAEVGYLLSLLPERAS